MDKLETAARAFVAAYESGSLRCSQGDRLTELYLQMQQGLVPETKEVHDENWGPLP